ncbi:MAG: two component regulator propeller/histidine kinase domain protein [Candidatus Sulfotelmatobacter sp.]|nr:two component regulator propeller/histidine kinase domain protein [Candidatus Sulfotelmatobacter sp.]
MKANSISTIRKMNRPEGLPAVVGKSDDSLTGFEKGPRFRYWMQSASMEMVMLQVKDGILVCDAQGIIVLANAGAKQLARQNPEGKALDLLEDIWGELFDLNGSSIPVEAWPLMKALRGERVSHKECRLIRLDGSASDLLFSASPIIDLARRIVGAVATLTDISEQKREEAIQHEEALERERSRMATHIHDTVSQSLTAISLQLQAVEHELHQNLGTAENYLHSAIGVARDSLADLRRCIWTLSHESLEGEDLAEALSFLADRLFTATPLKLELSLQREAASLPREVRHEILWISKEALANVLKHSEATKVRIELLCGEKEVQLRVEDNGCGFGPDRSSRTKGSFGLISMRKRAQRLGGHVAVDSQPGRGTNVLAVVPFLRD